MDLQNKSPSPKFSYILLFRLPNPFLKNGFTLKIHTRQGDNNSFRPPSLTIKLLNMALRIIYLHSSEFYATISIRKFHLDLAFNPRKSLQRIINKTRYLACHFIFNMPEIFKGFKACNRKKKFSKRKKEKSILFFKICKLTERSRRPECFFDFTARSLSRVLSRRLDLVNRQI